MKEKKNRIKRFPAGSLLKTTQEGITTDPLGSYTGVPTELYDTPVQDADDL